MAVCCKLLARWLASKAKNETAVQFGMNAIYRQVLHYSLTNKENMVADNGHFDGTEINSYRMLWSIAGDLGVNLPCNVWD